jgi:predicted transposase/invertase (TIGR01784 family)
VRPDFTSKNIQAAAEKLDLLKMPEKERKAYERYMIDRASERDMIETARIEGNIKGKLEGKLEGKFEIAANMLRKGKYTLEEIAEATGLREEQVRELELRKNFNDSTE